MEEKVEFRHHKFFDIKGVFSFTPDGVTVSSLWKKEFITYGEITAVKRQCYDRQTSFGITRANPNEYRIELQEGRALVFRVAHGEEDAYQRAIDSLNRKIYGMNRLGVGLASKARRSAAEQRQKNVQFEKEKPLRDFSLERAIGALLLRCGLELGDFMDHDTRSSKKKSPPFSPMDEGLYVELAGFVSGHDRDTISEVADKTRHCEDYYKSMTKKHPHRGMNENTTKEDVRWFAMIDTLLARGYAQEVDWKDGMENIARGLQHIANRLGIQLDTSMDLSYLDGNETMETLEMPRILNLIGMNTVEQGYSLASIDIESDGYVLCLLPNKLFKQCEKLLWGTKFSISSF